MNSCTNIKFLHPFTSILSGPTGSGKTLFVRNLLFNIDIIHPKPERVFYCYSEWQPLYDGKKLSLRFLPLNL